MFTSSGKFQNFITVFGLIISLTIQGDYSWIGPFRDGAHQSPLSSKHPNLAREEIPMPIQFSLSTNLGKQDPDYYFRSHGQSSYIHFNSHTGITTSINSASLRVRAGEQSWSNSLVTWGRGKTNQDDYPINPVLPLPRGRGSNQVGKYSLVAADNHLEYRFPGITAWFSNGPLGLQQGWTIHRAPLGNKYEPLTLVLALGGNLRASVESGGRSLALLDSGGTEILRYGGLLALDSTSLELEARFVLDGDHLLVQVEDAEAVYPLTIDPWVQLAKLTTGNGSLGDYLGISAAMDESGSTVVLGATYDGGVGVDKGALFVYQKFEGDWADTLLLYDAKLTASDGANDDNLGYPIAINEYGDTIVAGVPGNDSVASDAGAVYLFDRIGIYWKDGIQTAKLVDPMGVVNDGLGSSVAIDAYGIWVAVGAPYFHIDVHSNVGKVCIFRIPMGGWTGTVNPAAYITVNGYQDGDMFGKSVALNYYGTLLVGGAPATGAGGDNKGALYVYQIPGGGLWTSTSSYRAKLYDQNAQAGDTLGRVVTIDYSGETIAAGMYDLDDPGINRGAVYVYVAPTTGWATTGDMTAVLSAHDGADGDCLGWSVTMDNYGNVIAAGAPYNDTGGTDRGIVLVYERPSGGWQNTSFYNAKLTNNDSSAIKGLGYSLGMNGAGVSLVAGAPNLDGRAYIYDRGASWTSTGNFDHKLISADGRTDDYLGFSSAVSYYHRWQMLALGAPQYDYNASNQGAVFLYNPGSNWWVSSKFLTKLYTADGAADDNLGYSVGINAYGNIIAAGAPNRDGTGLDRGAVYVFDSAQGNTPIARLTASDAVDGDWLGWSVAVSGDGKTIVAGAPSRNGSGNDKGAIYVWVNYDPNWSHATQTAILTASDGLDGDMLGYAVSVNYDGSIITAGAPYRTVSTLSPEGNLPAIDYDNAGAVYIYTRPSGGWTSTSTFSAKLAAGDPATDAYLGRALALSPDGSTLAAGSFKSGGFNRGAVYVFEKGTAWSSGASIAKLISSDSGTNDQLGFSVAIDYDGSTIAAGSVNHASGGTERGAVYVYSRPVIGWVSMSGSSRKLVAQDGINWDHLGYSVAIDDTGRFILAGAPNADVQDWDRGAGYFWWNQYKLYLPVVKR